MSQPSPGVSRSFQDHFHFVSAFLRGGAEVALGGGWGGGRFVYIQGLLMLFVALKVLKCAIIIQIFC